MTDLFFSLTYTTFEQMMIKILVFMVISGLLLYVIWFILSKLLYRKTDQRREISLRLSLLWSCFVFFLVFSIYLILLFYFTGIERIDFSQFSSYLGILAQLVIFIALIVFFLITRQGLKNIIHKNSII